jgi:hypothetical protein
MVKMKKGYLFLVVAILLLPSWLYALDKDGNFESIEEQDIYIADTLKKMVIEMNSQAPFMMDSETQFSSALALKKTINFTMRLINLSSKEVDAKEISKYVWANVNDIACKNKATRDLIDLGVSYVYIYFGKDDRFITRVVLDEYKCNNQENSD